MSIGWALKTYRTRPRVGITQKALAKKTGIAYTRLCKFESEFAIPTQVELRAICKVLKIPQESLIALAKAEEPILGGGQ